MGLGVVTGILKKPSNGKSIAAKRDLLPGNFIFSKKLDLGTFVGKVKVIRNHFCLKDQVHLVGMGKIIHRVQVFEFHLGPGFFQHLSPCPLLNGFIIFEVTAGQIPGEAQYPAWPTLSFDPSQLHSPPPYWDCCSEWFYNRCKQSAENGRPLE